MSESILGKLAKKGKAIKSGQCVWCKKKDLTFRDDLSHKEYLITGCCQECQDRLFEVPDENA